MSTVCLVELAGDVEIALFEHELVGLHHVDLERDARSTRPVTVEFGGWDSRVKEQGPFGTPTRLHQHLCRQHPEREPGVDEFVGQAVGGESTALDDRVEADLLAIADTVDEFGEGFSVI